MSKKNKKSTTFNTLRPFSNFLKIGPFEAVHAKSNPCSQSNSPRKDSYTSTPTVPPCPVDKNAGGDAPSPRTSKISCAPESAKSTAGDRGKTGAGVSGSRIGRDRDKNTDELPAGATNPGLLRYIHNAARYRLPQCFEGASISVKQSSNNNWVLGHSLSFSSVSPGGYKVLLSYLDKNNPVALPYFVMEAAPGGQMSCEMRVGPTHGTRATIVAQIADAEFYSFESIFDAYFNNFTASVIAVNREFIALHYLQRAPIPFKLKHNSQEQLHGRNGVMVVLTQSNLDRFYRPTCLAVAHMLSEPAVSEHLSLGAEIVARGHASELSSASGAGRWATEDHSISATLGNRGLDLCYARALKPFLTVAAMLEVGFAIRRAVATLAYEWRTEQWTVRGSADSDGLVGVTLQRALGGERAQLACAISALLNHPNDKFRLGFGVTAAII